MKNLFSLWIAVAAVTLVAAGCSSRHLITSTGVHALRLGDPMPPEGTERLKGHWVRDTFVEQEDFQWREVVMDYRKGRVYLEEEFFGSGQLGRVRVQTPQLRTRNGLRVGMHVSDLLAHASDWTLAPLPQYDLFDAYSRTMPHIHFILDDPAVPKDRGWEEYKIDQLAPTSPIKMIVVF